MMRKSWISFLLFCSTTCCTAQTAGYKFYAPLDSVKKTGFHKIVLTQETKAHLKIDYSDLRIVNDSGKWIPHVLNVSRDEMSFGNIELNLKFTKTENSFSNTILIIENHRSISSIGLVIRNTAAERYCTLSGSDDKTNWSIINDSILINPSANSTSTENIFTLRFPISSYKFFKLVINNKNKDPFNITDVVWESGLAPSSFAGKMVNNPKTVIEQKDSGKISYIKITQQQAFHFEMISLKLSGVKYFSRKVELYIPSSNNHSFSNPGNFVDSFTISNNSTLDFELLNLNAPIFYLLIHNEDNLPLKIIEVNTADEYRYITAYLEKASHYKLIMGNESATKPDYDLADTNIKMPDSIPFISFGKIIGVEQTPVTVEKIKNNKWILWAAIIAVLLILLLFTRKMVKEVDKRKEHDSL